MTGAELLIPLIIKVGIEAAYHIVKVTRENKMPTEEEWQTLLTISQKTYDDYMKGPAK